MYIGGAGEIAQFARQGGSKLANATSASDMGRTFLMIVLFGYQLYYSAAACAGCGATVGPIQMVWMLTNSRMPKEESSRP